MSLSGQIQSQAFFNSLHILSRNQLLGQIIECGNSWFDAHPHEIETIRKNCEFLGKPLTAELLKNIQYHIFMHYYEKMLFHLGSPEELHHFLRSCITITGPIDELQVLAKSNQGGIVAICHFGAMGLIGPALTAHGIPVEGWMRFPDELSATATSKRAEVLSQSKHFAPGNFIPIKNGGGAMALEMVAAIRRGAFVLSMFDQKTKYSTQTTLLGKTILGGAGLDRIARYASGDTPFYCCFMVRTGKESYEMRIAKIGPCQSSVDQLYWHLQNCLTDHFEQWYFLHEEIPFVITSSL